MSYFATLLIAILANVISYYICKWSDSDNDSK